MRNEPCGRLLGMGGHLHQSRSPRDWLILAGSPHVVPPVEITGERWLPRARWPSATLSLFQTLIPP
eukprot:99258-Lingulodinium_polyedra.AAC.1